MPTLEEIHVQLEHLDGASKLLGRKEIRFLPEIMWEDEKLEKLVQGLYQNGNGILCATNKRLIFVDKGLISGLRVEDFAYDKISSIQYSTGLVFGKLTFYASGNKAEIEQVEKSQVRAFADYVRARISCVVEHASAPQKPSGTDDVYALLEKLGKLKETGVLTTDEFEEKKKELLARI